MSNDRAFLQTGLGRRTLGALLLSGFAPGTAEAASPQPGAAVTMLGDALLRRGALTPKPASYVISPYNLHATLGLLALGARGHAGPEFTRLLGAGGSTAHLAAVLARGRRAVSGADGAVTLGYSAWAARGHRFDRNWQTLARAAEVPRFGTLDFGSPGAAPIINAWANRATHGKIPRIVEQLPSGAELVLAGAIHFVGTWAVPFSPEDTAALPFHRLDGSVAPVPTMQAQVSAGYGGDDLGHAVRLGYRGGRLALWVGAARQASESRRFLEMLAGPGPGGWLQSLHMPRSQIVVRLPKIGLAGGDDMLPALRDTAFGRVLGQTIPGILRSPVRPAQILHRARIELDERGTVAAAATAVVGMRSMPQTELFEADRPFVFVLGLAEPWMPLFMGYVGDASAI